MEKRTRQISYAIRNNGGLAKKALMLLWQNQTPIERRVGISLENNFIGFDAIDDEFMSECADILSCDGFDLDFKQIAKLKKKLPKYAGQLARIELVGVKFPI